MKGGVGRYSVLQKYVALETGVKGKEDYCWRIPTCSVIALRGRLVWKTGVEGKVYCCWRILTITKG